MSKQTAVEWLCTTKTLNLYKMNIEVENLNEPQNPQLNIGVVIGSAYSDSDLQDRVNYCDHYTRYGESHYADTQDWRILEIYWEKILDRVLNELEIEEHQVEPMADRISALF